MEPDMTNDLNNNANEIISEEWLTAAEFAERAGISTVAVYKRFKEGSEFYKVDENGSKRFSSKALELYANQGNKQNNELTKLINLYETLINDYKTEIEALSNIPVVKFRPGFLCKKMSCDGLSCPCFLRKNVLY